MCGHHPLHHLPIYPPYPVSAPNHAPGPSVTRVSTAPCPGCGSAVQEGFVFCPQCGRQLLKACSACHRAIHADWTHCAFCGADLLAEKTGASAPSH